MPIAVLKLVEEWWSPPAEKDAAGKDAAYVAGEFLLGPLSMEDRETAQNMSGVQGQLGTWVYFMVRKGLRNWRALRGPNGDASFVAGPDKGPTDASMEMLGWNLCVQLANEIRRRSFVTEAERGN